MITIRTLETTTVSQIHQTFKEAFSDYEVKVDISLSDFIEMLVARDIQLIRSVGAFDDELLVGFILCGYRDGFWYDGGTGVIASHRNQKLASKMLEYLFDIVDSEQGEFLLEVLEHNTVAKQLYERYGCVTTRVFDCYSIETGVLASHEIDSFEFDHTADSYGKLDINRYLSYEPSWQNARKSILNNMANYQYVGLIKDKKTIAYGIMNTAKGDIAQLGFLKGFRKANLERILICVLASYTKKPRLVMLNVQRGNRLGGLLQNMGWTVFVSQYEMKRMPQNVNAS
ncbi:MAG: GNAT family N-acetyltransferase [Sphaerochaetaceae bacterium]|jgi:ribosomal protein S18 acetylase RimI-like enzyme|nr:GNAT family N-acetyltransferase [Sphaerochaetaceae bacterium]MDD2406267.1 GNAT family N-acetyltransferase [Sphaerochaetaceae bacterium]MDD3670889.1 GNAT family N-acetyltransferase [Sphaerochaetaceae bacterium]MDD4260232.1 GNAT family N-acetyltransferase [Sphaerochaetaceae bacterium]MDD4762597.1 GNAT family N-acetyltransferase [Sphaerochaetaceae bacterium]